MTLSRSIGLKRSAFKRSEAKEASAVKKLRAKKCQACRQPFEPRSAWAQACSPDCAAIVAQQKREADERKADKVRKDALKGRSDWLKDAQTAFNAFIRERDKDRPCICCGRIATTVDGLNSHGWDCGHYRSVGSAPHMRFIENNAHRQLVLCNRYGGGRAVDYRVGLIARIGLSAVEELEADNTARKYTVDELKAIKALYVAKLKELRK